MRLDGRMKLCTVVLLCIATPISGLTCVAGQFVNSTLQDVQLLKACYPRTYYSAGYDDVETCKDDCRGKNNASDYCPAANYDTDGGCYHCSQGYSVVTHAGESNSGTIYAYDKHCSDCTSGTWSNANAASCSSVSDCSAGYYCPLIDGSTPIACGVGTFSSTVGATSVDTCQSCSEASTPAATTCPSAPTATPSAAPTAAPNAAPSTHSQTIAFSMAPEDYTGLIQTLAEKGYGTNLGIYTSGSGWTTGCSVTSTASRRSTAVTFTSTVPQTMAGTVSAAATVVTPASLSTNINSVQASETAYAGVAVVLAPTPSYSPAPTPSPSTSSASSATHLAGPTAFAYAAMALAPLLRR